MIKSWSYSRLKIFERCPYQSHLMYTEKRPDTSDKTAADRGTQAHNDCELFVAEDGPLTKEMKKFTSYFADLKVKYQGGEVILEEEWGFDLDWQPTDYWGDEIWCRMKLDNLIWTNEDKTRATATDYKTGKKFGNEVSHNQQGQLYVLGTFLRYPDVEVVDCEFVYLDHGLTSKKTYTRDKAMKFLPMWDKRAKNMTEAEAFPPKPNKINCRFCPYGPNKGDSSCEWGVEI